MTVANISESWLTFRYNRRNYVYRCLIYVEEGNIQATVYIVPPAVNKVLGRIVRVI
jgi:hypothetical protein